ncbi:unnamed protein product [Clonostachys byssicola]|uniref:Uncharacterized protein n=1 Tax=Clonostachys byssicola TaxID=160290 RepID=A0A9N9XZ55_9HYPO|nr:unnamed protein product [Clonostachys byssicola]
MLEYWPEMLYSGIRERCWVVSRLMSVLVGFTILRENGVLIEDIVRSTAALGNPTSLMVHYIEGGARSGREFKPDGEMDVWYGLLVLAMVVARTTLTH